MSTTKTADTQESTQVEKQAIPTISVNLPKLRLGDVQNEVLSLKLLLVGFGYSVGKLDNVLDNQSFLSMQRFQKVNHLKVNDYCDKNTWERLLSITK